METTPRCQMALRCAKESLSRLGHSHVSSAHLVLGLLTLCGGIADRLLCKSGLSVESVEGYLSIRRPSVEAVTILDGIPLGKSGLQAFERAVTEAQTRGFNYVGIEFLLLGILAEDSGEATDLFASVHVDQGAMSRTIQEEIQ